MPAFAYYGHIELLSVYRIVALSKVSIEHGELPNLVSPGPLLLLLVKCNLLLDYLANVDQVRFLLLLLLLLREDISDREAKAFDKSHEPAFLVLLLGLVLCHLPPYLLF